MLNVISYFDNSIVINREVPAVSLIIAASQSLRHAGSNSIAYHAQIWIERIEENGLRRFYIEFNAPERGHERNKAFKGGTVKVYDGHKEEPIYAERLGTWRIEAYKVNLMIEQARREMQNPLGCPQAFNILGSESFFTRKQKACETSDLFLQTFQICNNKLFRWMYRTAEETIKTYPTDERYRYQNIIDDPNFIPWGGLLWGEKGVWLVDVAIDELRREVAFTECNTYSNDMGGHEAVKQNVLWRDVLSKFSVQFIRDALFMLLPQTSVNLLFKI